jgi:hypothetical protein
MASDETHDAACRCAFRKTFRRSPTPDVDYKLALDERNHLGLNDALPIFSRLRSEAGLAPAKARPEHRWKVAVTVIEPSASPAAPPPEPEPPQPEPPVSASPPAGNGRPRAKERSEAFVREQLANGPRQGESIKRDAAAYDLRAHVERGRRAPGRAHPARAVVDSADLKSPPFLAAIFHRN